MGFLSGLGRMFFGSKPGKPEYKQIQRFTPEQQANLSKLLSQGMADVDPALLEKRYRGQFERETVPGLAERFTAMGGGQRSAAFEESLRRGGLDLAEQLAGVRAQMGMQKLGLGLQPQFDTMMIPGAPGTSGILGNLIGQTVGNIGGGLSNMLTSRLFGGGAPQYRAPMQQPMGRYMAGQPRGYKKSYSPVLMKIMQGLTF